MDWNERFDAASRPTEEDIRRFLGCAEPLWTSLTSFLEDTYRVQPRIEYSKCPGQPGWNVKYRKGGKALCTLYPLPDSFIALVVVGVKEEPEVQARLESFTPYVRDLYARTPTASFGRWLMVEVRNTMILEDITELIAIRIKTSA